MTNEKTGNVHNETRNILRKHPSYEKGKIISKNLNRLRKMRNEADYDNNTSKPLEEMLINAKLRSKFILEQLKEFN